MYIQIIGYVRLGLVAVCWPTTSETCEASRKRARHMLWKAGLASHEESYVLLDTEGKTVELDIQRYHDAFANMVSLLAETSERHYVIVGTAEEAARLFLLLR